MPFHKILRTGCGVSKKDGNGMDTQSRIPPGFRDRLDEIRRRRQSRPTKESTPSKKELLLHVNDEDEIVHSGAQKGTSMLDHDNVSCVTSEGSNNTMHESLEMVGKGEAFKDMEKDIRVAKIVESIDQEEKEKDHGVHGHEEHEKEDDDNYDDERAIKHHGEDGPGSPSFRVYFTKNNDKDKKNEADKKDDYKVTTPVAANISETKDPVAKEGKKERKWRSIRDVIQKNLLNVRSCYSAAHPAQDRTHLLPGKAPA